MKKFKYSHYSVPFGKDGVEIFKSLNNLGSQGWELCGSYKSNDGIQFILKREIQSRGHLTLLKSLKND